jgi:hypothetical protein
MRALPGASCKDTRREAGQRCGFRLIIRRFFGGTWSTSPDPSDFHFFSTIDLYAPHANFYRRPDGVPNPISAITGSRAQRCKQLAGLESVLGDYGGQLASFEWVFSPRGPDGRPKPLFNRATGEIDPEVAAYWRKHYDIVEYLNTNWKTIGVDLRGKIHLIVGTDDTFYLDGAAHSLESALKRLGGDPHFTFCPAGPTSTSTWKAMIVGHSSTRSQRRCTGLRGPTRPPEPSSAFGN